MVVLPDPENKFPIRVDGLGLRLAYGSGCTITLMGDLEEIQ